MRKKEKSTLIVIIIIALCVIGLIFIFVFDVVEKVKRGWNNSDTITVAFSLMVSTSVIVIDLHLRNYLINNNKKIVMLNNDIYRLFLKMEENKNICKYESQLIDEDINKYLEKINQKLRKKKIDILVTTDNISCYIFRNDLDFFTHSKLLALKSKIEQNKSYKYEALYRCVHNGDLIRKSKSPLIGIIVPLLLSMIGLFATIYQNLASNNSVGESLIEYLKLFGVVVAWSSLFSLLLYSHSIDTAITEKINVLNDLKAIDESSIN